MKGRAGKDFFMGPKGLLRGDGGAQSPVGQVQFMHKFMLVC